MRWEGGVEEGKLEVSHDFVHWYKYTDCTLTYNIRASGPQMLCNHVHHHHLIIMVQCTLCTSPESH